MGSSPLTRGKQHGVVLLEQVPGLIPAHAGKTPSGRTLNSATWAHPRSRGENDGTTRFNVDSTGSSPLTRGKLQGEFKRDGHGGLIPAHAGKTVLVLEAVGLHGAHPRSRGENVWSLRQTRRCSGSSPLTRGKHFLTCAFTAQIDQILETLELAASFGSYLIWVACATDAPQDPVRSIGLVLPSSMGAS